jgi:hypothetical protein
LDSGIGDKGKPLRLLTLYNGEPTIPQVHYYHNNIEIYARFRYSLLDGLGALVEFAQAGSIARAADRLGIRKVGPASPP